MIDFKKILADKDIDTLRQALLHVLQAHNSPVFGAAKPVEHEVAAIRAFQVLGVLTANPDEYELVMTLRVTKAKARALLYQNALRQVTNKQQMDEALRALLSEPRVCKEGDMVLVEVPQPLLMDTLRHRVRELGFISDGSFSGAVARIPAPALVALVASLIPDDKRAEVEKALRRKGVHGDDLRSLIAGAIGKFGQSVAGAAGKRVAEHIGDALGDFLIDGGEVTFEWVAR